MDSELTLLESDELKFSSYFPAYNEAKCYLRESRQNLRKLATRTVNEVRDLKILLEELDESKDTVLLTAFLEIMKDLFNDTLKTLKEALGKFISAKVTFEILNSSIGKQNRKLEKMTTKNSAEYDAWTQKLIRGFIAETTTADIIADFFGVLGNYPNFGSTEIQKYAAKLEELKTITDRMLEAGGKFDST